MKKLFLMMLFLAIVVPANAEVFVYTMSEKEVSILEDWPEWSIEKESIKGYLILEDTGDTTTNMWFISTFKESGLKLAGAAQLGEVELINAEIGNKIIKIITNADPYSLSQRIFLTGQVKLNAIVIGSKAWDAPTKLTGTAIWDSNETPGERDIGSATISLTLHKKYTVYAIEQLLDGVGTKDYVMGILKEQGYEEMEPGP